MLRVATTKRPGRLYDQATWGGERPVWEVTSVNRFLNSIVTWVRAGYPNGVPQNDYLPMLALLSRRLTADEIIEVARQLRNLPEPDFIDVGAEILRITDQLPKPSEVDRVRAKLAAFGWPLDDPRDAEETE